MDDSPSREEWKFPLLKIFINWLIGFVSAALLILAGLYGAYMVMRPAAVEDTKPAIADMGIPASKPSKHSSPTTAIKNKADQVINTPAVAEIIPVIPAPVTPKSLTPAEQDFANRLSTFESKL